MIDVRPPGPLIIEIDGKAPRPELLRPMNTALFLYLALSGRRSRDQVIGLRWPDKPQKAAARSQVDWAFGVLARWRRARLGASDADLCSLYQDVARLWKDGEPR